MIKNRLKLKEAIIKSEYDFSQADQGKFYHPDATFHYPIYLDPAVEQFVTKIAEQKKI